MEGGEISGVIRVRGQLCSVLEAIVSLGPLLRVTQEVLCRGII